MWDAANQFSCFSNGGYIIAFGAIYVVVDVVLTLIPAGIIWKMQLPTMQKVGLWGLFFLGTVSSVAAILRMYYSYVAFFSTRGTSDISCELCPDPWPIID